MASSQNTNTSLPQGFSVFQPALGQQLQFFPAIGTQQLDDMMNAFIPGPASIQEKRATISLDFLEYAQLTGETFKFYPVYSFTPSNTASPVTASPMVDSMSSSFNVSPVTPSWDFSNVATPASSSAAPARAARGGSRKAASPPSRHQITDFSHLPGMKIMTREGVDVTNSASRGSKTKEQRDHAHLMRIIKACDSCKKKKIRCDPSHKKRGSSQPVATPKPAQKTAKKSKAAVPQEIVPVAPAVVAAQESLLTNSPIELDPLFAPELMEFEATAGYTEPWEEFINYPSYLEVEEDYDFFLDPHGHLSPQGLSSQTTPWSSGSSLASPDKSNTPLSSQDSVEGQLGVPEGEQVLALATMPYDQQQPGLGDYVDFNLFSSPESSFSEDERMVSSSSNHVDTALPPHSEWRVPGGDPPTITPFTREPGFQDGSSGVSAESSVSFTEGVHSTVSSHTSSDNYVENYHAGGEYYDPGVDQGIQPLQQPAEMLSTFHLRGTPEYNAGEDGDVQGTAPFATSSMTRYRTIQATNNAALLSEVTRGIEAAPIAEMELYASAQHRSHGGNVLHDITDHARFGDTQHAVTRDSGCDADRQYVTVSHTDEDVELNDQSVNGSTALANVRLQTQVDINRRELTEESRGLFAWTRFQIGERPIATSQAQELSTAQELSVGDTSPKSASPSLRATASTRPTQVSANNALPLTVTNDAESRVVQAVDSSPLPVESFVTRAMADTFADVSSVDVSEQSSRLSGLGIYITLLSIMGGNSLATSLFTSEVGTIETALSIAKVTFILVYVLLLFTFSSCFSLSTDLTSTSLSASEGMTAETTLSVVNVIFALAYVHKLYNTASLSSSSNLCPSSKNRGTGLIRTFQRQWSIATQTHIVVQAHDASAMKIQQHQASMRSYMPSHLTGGARSAMRRQQDEASIKPCKSSSPAGGVRSILFSLVSNFTNTWANALSHHRRTSGNGMPRGFAPLRQNALV